MGQTVTLKCQGGASAAGRVSPLTGTVRT